MQSKPDRKKRLPPAAQVLENRNNREKGEIVAFLNLQEKLWFLVLECMPLSKLESRVKEMSEKGFKHVVKEIVKKDEGTNFFRRPQKFQQPTRQLQVPPTCEINDGMKWEFSVVDDIKVNSESNYMENRELHYFRYLPESYRHFVIEPKTNEERAISGAINLDPLGIEDKNLQENCTCSIQIEIDEETVKAYFKPEFVPEEPEPKKEKVNFDILNTPVFKEDKPEVPIIQKFKPLPPTVMERLMRTNRKPIISKQFSHVQVTCSIEKIDNSSFEKQFFFQLLNHFPHFLSHKDTEKQIAHHLCISIYFHFILKKNFHFDLFNSHLSFFLGGGIKSVLLIYDNCLILIHSKR